MNTLMSDTEIEKAILNLLVALVTLGAGWFVGQRLSFRWNIRQKQREFFYGRRVSTTLRHSGLEFSEYFRLCFGVC